LPAGHVAATRLVTLKLTPSAAAIITAMAALNHQAPGGFVRDALATAVAEALEGDPAPVRPDGPRPPSTRATVAVPVNMTPATDRALRQVAARQHEPLTAVIRRALEVAVAECGGPDVMFPATRADGRRWPQRRCRPETGFAHRHYIGFQQPRWWARKVHRDEE
jgi:hypothetical protein